MQASMTSRPLHEEDQNEDKPNMERNYIITYPSGVIYEGHLNSQEQRHGFGTLTTKTTRYEGQFQNDKRQGWGKLVWKSSHNVYTGHFHEGKIHGHGTLLWSRTGDVYTGEWQNGKRHGEGLLTTDHNKCHVKGMFQDGLAHGWCEKKFANGDVHQGHYREDVRHGFGTYIWHDNPTRYTGEWKDGQRHGHGVQTCVRSQHDGTWQNDVAHGYGVQKYNNGDSYEGMYLDGFRHGDGIYQWRNGDVYTGAWVRGRMCGTGVKTMSNGDVFQGDWRFDQTHGVGTKWFANGDVHCGEYRHDQRQGRGVYEYVDGSRYEGDWKDGLQSGISKFYFANGDWAQGRWDKGKKHGPAYHHDKSHNSVYIEIWSRGSRMHRENLTPEQLRNLPSLDELWKARRPLDELRQKRIRSAHRTILSRPAEKSLSVESIVDTWRWCWESQPSEFWGNRFRRRGLLQRNDLIAEVDMPMDEDLEIIEEDVPSAQHVAAQQGIASADNNFSDGAIENTCASLEPLEQFDHDENSDSSEDRKPPARSPGPSQLQLNTDSEGSNVSDTDADVAFESQVEKHTLKREHPSFSSSSSTSRSRRIVGRSGIRLSKRRTKKRKK